MYVKNIWKGKRMKKNYILLIVMAVAFLFLFTGCEDEIKSYTVSFETNFKEGGISFPPVTVLRGESVKEPADPSFEGMKLCGWYLDDKPYDFSNPVTSDITLVAKWDHYKHIFNERDICSICNGEKCGEDVVFFYDKDTRTLSFDGRGEICDYLDEKSNFLDRPWETILSEITKVVVGEGITKIGNAAFALLDDEYNVLTTSIKEILLPTSLEEIGTFSFVGASIEKIVIPDGTSKLGGDAFFSCTSLSEITIPASISEIGGEVFDDSPVSKVIFLGTEEQWVNLNLDIDNTDYDVYLKNEDRYLVFNFYYDNDGKLRAQYLTKYGKELTEIVVPDYFCGINSSTFKDSKATIIHIPASVESIEENTFAGLSNVTIYVDKTEDEFKSMYTSDKGVNNSFIFKSTT